MISADKVYDYIVSGGVYAEASDDKIRASCRQAVDWLARHLKETADSESDLALRTAAAMARFYIFVINMGESRSYENFKVGDMTVKRDLQKEYEIEKELRTRALCDAAEILKDGGFYFVSNSV